MAKCLCSADLNRLVTVKNIKTNATIESSGHVDKSDDANWTTVGKEWCQFITSGSREFLIGNQVNAQITHQITMRYSKQATNYTTECRLEYDGRIFNLAGPPQNVDEQNKWLRFPAIEAP